MTMEKTEKGFVITRIHIDVVARIPDGDMNAYETTVKQARENCPVSRLLNAEISVDAKLSRN